MFLILLMKLETSFRTEWSIYCIKLDTFNEYEKVEAWDWRWLAPLRIKEVKVFSNSST